MFKKGREEEGARVMVKPCKGGRERVRVKVCKKENERVLG